MMGAGMQPGHTSLITPSDLKAPRRRFALHRTALASAGGEKAQAKSAPYPEFRYSIWSASVAGVQNDLGWCWSPASR
jgi:hypothetical protein